MDTTAEGTTEEDTTAEDTMVEGTTVEDTIGGIMEDIAVAVVFTGEAVALDGMEEEFMSYLVPFHSIEKVNVTEMNMEEYSVFAAE